MVVGLFGGHAPAVGALEEAQLHQERFHDIHDGVGFLADAGGQRLQADWASPEIVKQAVQQHAVGAVHAQVIDPLQFEGLLRDGASHGAVALDLCVVAGAAQQAQRHPGCAAGPDCDFHGSRRIHFQFHQPTRTQHDLA